MWTWLGAAPPVVTPEVHVSADDDDNNDTERETAKENVTGETETEPSDITKDDSEDSGIIPTKNVKQVASQLGSYLYGFANVATNTASKLKESATVHLDKTILGDFNRENEKFRQEKENRRIGDGVPPWVGYHEESAMKRQILALSTDERNFLRSPPSGVDFIFDVEQKMPVAMATLKEDENLEKMRFQLVPKRITEEKFWRNYFYRVSLVKQSTQLSSMADQETKASPHSSSTESLNKSSEIVEVDVPQEESSSELTEDNPETSVVNEFVSDSFQDDEGLSEEEMKQVMGEGLSEEEMKQVMGSTSEDPLLVKCDSNDFELDKELQKELESFELVNTGEEENDDWEKEIEDLIELES